uniref:HTH_Tnp_Tc3_2 domain-containing protein n=1 Tax=Haemonchus contortus TaxID=6289 RepID=A0A7I4YX69_HAECO
MARDMGISRKSVERGVNEDLKMYPNRTRKAAILSASNQQARVKMCRQLLLRTRNRGHHAIAFSDEELFTVEQQFNAQNVRVIARNAEEVDRGVCRGEDAVDSRRPRRQNRQRLLPEDDSGRCYTPVSEIPLQRPSVDIPPAHKAEVVQAWCKSELRDFISAEEWLASSTNLNSLDHYLWSYLGSKACASPHPNLDSLKAALIREWYEIDDALLRPTIDAFPKRLRAVVRAEGDRIEK